MQAQGDRPARGVRLSGTALKLIAMVTMLLDHIHYMFSFTGRVPLWFSQLARISAPIFLFCLAEGFVHTRSRRRYFLRVYLLAAAMGLARCLMLLGALPARADGFVPENSILTTYALLLLIWQGLDDLRARRVARGLALTLAPLLWPALLARLLPHAGALRTPLSVLAYTLLPAWGTSGDTGYPVLIIGTIFYLLRERRALQLAAFAAFALGPDLLATWAALAGQPGFAPAQMVTDYYQWMEVLAVPLLACYDGTRGRGLRGLFYAFYPGHVYVLYALSCALHAVWGG